MAFQAFRVEAPPGLLRGPFGAQNGSQNGFGSAPKMAPKIGPPKEAKNGRRRPSKGPQVGPQIGPKSASDPSRAPLGIPRDTLGPPPGPPDPPRGLPGPPRTLPGTPPGPLRDASGTPPGPLPGLLLESLRTPFPPLPPGARAQDVPWGRHNPFFAPTFRSEFDRFRCSFGAFEVSFVPEFLWLRSSGDRLGVRGLIRTPGTLGCVDSEPPGSPNASSGVRWSF